MSRTLRRGDQGPDVAELQRDLSAAGYPVPPLGHFGPITEAAVRDYQRAHELDDDGVAGPLTRASLDGAPPGVREELLVDVSQWSGVPDYGALRALGYTGVIPRLGSGVDGVDSLAERQITAAHAAGVHVETGYVYVKSWEPGDRQALHFLDLAKRFGLALWIDVEPAKPYASATRSWPVHTDAPSLYRPVAMACFDALRGSGVAWGVYGAMFLDSLALPAWLASAPLWAATYGGPVQIPRPWTAAAIHQYEGDVPLAGAKVDLNRTIIPGGMSAALKAMGGS